ncbi:hypothetical protein ThrDRAFT_01988 [Frankia casuarinae]|nr:MULTISPECIES: hypothetical protein [unclassified Frankia]EYT92378.1 hypothetical protein ThrDRAFT_01988 [Frankia casuarinae]KDA42895.1 hypothetical protein BMG523Draft_02284 [Frankia sp. BMG5.23]ETA02212.1 hypothetical protein CcI6DRAFT_02387 [Frankia sp. CcI6]KEZ37546.1 hypothetical protein CEDDRAFT_01173 [Frankia sp. CeD]KFB06028.1 hypothetical protein ALLO2DRAFT_01313 [Frankia sp. Allo2]
MTAEARGRIRLEQGRGRVRTYLGGQLVADPSAGGIRGRVS